MSPDPADLAEQLQWPLGVQCSGATDCPGEAIGRTLALLQTARGHYHLLVTRNAFTRGRSLWVAWIPREEALLTLLDELPEGLIAQGLVVIADHLVAGQPS